MHGSLSCRTRPDVLQYSLFRNSRSAEGCMCITSRQNVTDRHPVLPALPAGERRVPGVQLFARSRRDLSPYGTRSLSFLCSRLDFCSWLRNSANSWLHPGRRVLFGFPGMAVEELSQWWPSYLQRDEWKRSSIPICPTFLCTQRRFFFQRIILFETIICQLTRRLFWLTH